MAPAKKQTAGSNNHSSNINIYTTTTTAAATTTSTTTAPVTATATISPDHQERLKAEARAYALSGTKRKSPANSASKGRTNNTALSSRAARSQPSRARKPSVPPATAAALRPYKQYKPTITVPKSSNNLTTQTACSSTASSSLHSTTSSTATGGTRQPASSSPRQSVVISEDDDEYQQFVKSLLVGDDGILGFGFDDDEDFRLSDAEEEDDDDDDDDEDENEEDGDGEGQASSSDQTNEDKRHPPLDSTPQLSSPLSASPLRLPEFESTFDLEQELGSLLEEDLEAAMTTLLSKKPPAHVNNTLPIARSTSTPVSTPSPQAATSESKRGMDASKTQQLQGEKDGQHGQKLESPATPLRESARQSSRTRVTYRQSQQLRRLMTKHYQLLVQQAILSVRAAHVQKQHRDKEKSDFMSGESADDLAEILDGAVGMLQDLDQVSLT